MDLDVVRRTVAELIGVGLAEAERGLHLRLDPALPAYLLGVLEASELDHWRRLWAEGMRALRVFLTKQRSQDAELALTVLELPNLLAWLEWLQARETHEAVVLQATQVEHMLAPLGRQRALAQVVKIRQEATQGLDAWGHARFVAERARVERLLDRDDLPGALAATERLLQQCLEAGDTAYAEAPYDIALARVLLGRILQSGGAAEAALAYLEEGQRQFEALAVARDDGAAQQASFVLSERADCLTALGRLGEAATAYEAAIERDESRGQQGDVAAYKFKLGTVHLLQRRYAEALAIFTEARKTFEALGQPGSVASVWHQIGIVHGLAGQVEQAEAAYRQALVMHVQQQDLSGEANTLGELGNLYDAMGRPEEAATFLRQALEKYVALKHLSKEGRLRSNLAITLIKLQRYDDARRELLRAIACNEPYGHTAEPWKAWAILHRLEHGAGHPQAAAEARQQAIQCYMAYRRDGGEDQTGRAQPYASVAQAMQQGETTEVAQALAQLTERAEVPSWGKIMIAKLQAILQGNRDPALAADPALDYHDAVELQLLLERLT